MKGVIFDIQRFCVHDGPGIRTTVFMKGCPLRCKWCHNPESQRPYPELMVYPDKCVRCGECLKVCPKAFDARCDNKGVCAAVCRHSAREVCGRTAAVEEIVAQVLRDERYYRTSGGGVTLSGGEPFFQPEFCLALLAACREAGLHTAVETAGCVPVEVLLEAAPLTDLFLYDIKGIDPEKHRQNTGAPNDLILSNARALSEAGADIRFRMPLIPGYNDDERAAVERFAEELSKPLEIMPYHDTGVSKYKALRREYTL